MLSLNAEKVFRFQTIFFINVVLFNVLVISYQNYNVPIFGYLGYVSDYSVNRTFIALCYLIPLSMICSSQFDALEKFVINIASFALVIPLLAIFACVGFDVAFLNLVFLQLFLIKWIGSYSPKKLKKFSNSRYLAELIALIVSVFSIIILFLNFGFQGLELDIFNIYEQRIKAKETVFNGLNGYILNWHIKVFLTFLLALGILKRSLLYFSFAILASFLSYAWLGQKIPLAMVCFVFLCFFLPKLSYVKLAVGIILVVLLSQYLSELYSFNVPYSIAVKRVFFAPAYAVFNYYEVFSELGHTYFSDSFLRSYIDYPFSASPQELVAIRMTGDTALYPNVGILGTGYQQGGYLMGVLYAILTGALVLTFKAISRNVDYRLMLSTVGPFLFILITVSDFPRALLTHGGGASLLMIYLAGDARRGT
jgi:hypothetical protein